MKKLRVLAVLAIVLILSITCMTTESQAASFVDGGSCGDNVNWMLDSEGVLNIYGSGAMYDYYDSENVPWGSYRESIKTIAIQSGVTQVGSYAFCNCYNATSAMIPDSVTSIGENAFYYCESLTSITIPNSVTSIGDCAFYYCESLTSITIPNSVTSIGDCAFYCCKSLTSIAIPNSVTSIEEGVFSRCTSLTNIKVNSSNSYYAAVNGVLFNKDKTTLIAYPGGKTGSYKIPNSVTSIGSYAFEGCESLTSITIPNSVISIGSYAFEGCESLTSMTIPNSVTSIGSYAFVGCESLTSVTIPNSVTSIGESAFFDCRSLTSITIPNSVTSVGGYMFSNCYSLISVSISNNATSIGKRAFTYCYSLTSITIPSSVTSVGQNAFEGCESLKKVVFNGDKPKLSSKVFTDVTAIAYYPASNSTWEGIEDQNFGGTITWKTHDMVELRITSQPKTAYAKSGSTVKTTVKAEGDGLKYQWYIRNADESKYSKSSVKSATYSCEMSSSSKDRRVYCVITDEYGNSVKSNTVRLRMAATITTQPKSATVYEGSTAKVTVKAIGDDLKYQWYIKNAGQDSYSKSSITKSSYSVEMSDKADGRKVYCVVTDKYGKTDKSDTATLTMKKILKITTQPKSVTVEKGETAKVTVKASGDGLKYQWYIKNAGQDSYSKSSVTKSSYSVEMSSKVDGRKVYCVVKDKYGESIKTNTVTLSMKNPLKLTGQPKSVTVEKGETAKVTVKASGDGLKYQWYIKNAGQDSYSKSSITKSSYSVEMSSKVDGRKVYCVVKDKYGDSIKTNTVTLTMKIPLEITTQPKSVTVDKGDTAKVTVKASGNGLTYQWFYMNAGQTKFSESSITKSSYSVEMSNKVSGRQVYCVITDASGKQVKTNTVILNITGGPKITTQPKNQTAGDRDVVNVSVVAEGKGLTYQWYFKDPDNDAYQTSASDSAKTSTYTFKMQESFAGRKLFCVITDSSGRKTTSSTITVKLG